MAYGKFNNVVIRDEDGEWDANLEGCKVHIWEAQVFIQDGKIEGFIIFQQDGYDEKWKAKVYDIERGNPICKDAEIWVGA